jgi:o-succinylbenzoate---CoA ligase
MPSQTLRVKEAFYQISDIQKGNFRDSHSPNENNALQFCSEWLNDRETFILQTSGSTGTPKKISVTRDQLKASAARSALYLGLKKEFTSLVCLDTQYIAGIMMLVRSLEVGMNLHVIEPSANPFDTLPEDVTIDFTALVPYQVQSLLTSKHKEKFSSTKVVLIGGAALSNSLRENLKSMHGSFYATYGMTETLSHIALQKLNGSDTTNYFHLLPGISIEQDNRGCLVIKAPHLNVEPIVTNDLVEIIDSNHFLILGRIDHVINSGGVKVFSEKVESIVEVIFSEFNLTNRFFIAGVPDLQLGEKVILCMEGNNLPGTMEEKLTQRLKDSLNRFEIPKEIRYIDNFIQTETGKINKPKTLARIASR